MFLSSFIYFVFLFVLILSNFLMIALTYKSVFLLSEMMFLLSSFVYQREILSFWFVVHDTLVTIHSSSLWFQESNLSHQACQQAPLHNEIHLSLTYTLDCLLACLFNRVF